MAGANSPETPVPSCLLSFIFWGTASNSLRLAPLQPDVIRSIGIVVKVHPANKFATV